MARTRVVLSPDGMDQLEAHVLSRALVPIGEQVAEDMRRYVPVLTGDLRGTIKLVLAGPLEVRITFGNVSGRIDYHLYVEFGTSIMDAQPYARPALFKTRSL